jgi:hypothetical protein
MFSRTDDIPMRWRLTGSSLVLTLCVACAATDTGVHSLSAVATTVVPTTSTSPVALSSFLFPGAPTAVFADAPTLMVPHAQQDAEMAVHALASTSDGWLAVGSTTFAKQHGEASVWNVAIDGTFEEVTQLPTPDAAPSLARGAISDTFGTIVVGTRGSGRQSVASAWILQPSSEWLMVDLPTDPAQTHGVIADKVLRLANGTTVVVGRGNGPFFSDLILWSSLDNGTTWTSTPAGKSFLEPLAATDGERVELFVRTYPDPATNYAGHTALVFGMEGDALVQLDISLEDLAPGRRYWPQALMWDGTEFVVGMQLDVGPAIATSTDGVNFSVTEFTPEGLDASAPSGIESLAMVDGSLVVAVEQLSTLYMFRREGANFTAIAIPHAPSGSLAYLDYRRLSASDGHRFTYVAADWEGLTQLSWDGQAWTSTPVRGLPKFRNSARLEVSTIASAAGADLALVSESHTEAPGKFVDQPAGLMWRPSGSETWQLFAMPLADMSTPVWITTWRDAFIVVGHDYALNRSTLFRVDPASGLATTMASLDGFVGRIVTDTDHVYARVSDVSGQPLNSTSLWQSSDGTTWSQIDLGFAPRTLCTDGTTAVVEWMTSSDDPSSTMGLATLDGNTVVPYSSPFDFQPYQVTPEPDQVMRCGVNGTGAVTTLQGYDRAIADSSPQSRMTNWVARTTSIEDLVMPVSPEGAWKSKIVDITWNGHEWIAVGSGIDVESASDALMWKSPDGLVWEPAITLAGGPGNQIANSVTIRNGEMLIGGSDGQQAIIWRLPA